MKQRDPNRKGSALISAYLVLAALLVFGSIFFTRTVFDHKMFNIQRERAEAFYLTESAVDRGINELKTSFTYTGTTSPVSLGRGEYEMTIVADGATRRVITAYGYVPSKASKRAERRIEAVVKRQTPPNFYDHAIYSADDVTLNGNSYVVNGDVIYADSINDTEHVTGTTSSDPTISPLAQFDFNVMRAIAVSQGNLYDDDRLDDIQHGDDSYPTDFWYVDPTDPSDPTTGVPNVVYIEGDMVLNGNIGTVGGFFLVVGNVLTDPNDTSDTTINGNGEIDGCVYTTGAFRINGGAGGLNVDGGVWAGTEARLNGNATVSFNEFFMDSIQNLVDINNAGSVVQLLSWRELS